MVFSKQLPTAEGGKPLIAENFETSISILARENRTLMLQGLIIGAPDPAMPEGRSDVFSPIQVLSDIMAMNIDDPKDPITIIINSGGGLIEMGMMLYDAIKLSKAPITTIGMNCASMATLLLAAGSKTLAFPHSRFVLHMLSSGFKGTLNQVETQTKEMNRIHEMVTDCYIECGLTGGLKSGNPKLIRKKLLKDIDKGDFYLSADEAVKYGLVDGIVKPGDLF